MVTKWTVMGHARYLLQYLTSGFRQSRFYPNLFTEMKEEWIKGMDSLLIVTGMTVGWHLTCCRDFCVPTLFRTTGTPVSITNQMDRSNIAEIFVKVGLNTISPTPSFELYKRCLAICKRDTLQDFPMIEKEKKSSIKCLCRSTSFGDCISIYFHVSLYLRV